MKRLTPRQLCILDAFWEGAPCRIWRSRDEAALAARGLLKRDVDGVWILTELGRTAAATRAWLRKRAEHAGNFSCSAAAVRVQAEHVGELVEMLSRGHEHDSQ